MRTPLLAAFYLPPLLIYLEVVLSHAVLGLISIAIGLV